MACSQGRRRRIAARRRVRAAPIERVPKRPSRNRRLRSAPAPESRIFLSFQSDSFAQQDAFLGLFDRTAEYHELNARLERLAERTWQRSPNWRLDEASPHDRPGLGGHDRDRFLSGKIRKARYKARSPIRRPRSTRASHPTSRARLIARSPVWIPRNFEIAPGQRANTCGSIGSVPRGSSGALSTDTPNLFGSNASKISRNGRSALISMARHSRTSTPR